MRKPLKTKDWTKFKQGMCDSCWARCCHGWPVQASVPDMIRLGLIKEKEASSNLAEVARKLKKQKWVRSFDKKQMVFELGRQRNGDCIFLNEKRTCMVYPNRPEICRQFPKIGDKPGFCPYEPK